VRLHTIVSLSMSVSVSLFHLKTLLNFILLPFRFLSRKEKERSLTHSLKSYSSGFCSFYPVLQEGDACTKY
jgi:hypothetical protein